MRGAAVLALARAVCEHHEYENVEPHRGDPLRDGTVLYREIETNATQYYFYKNVNTTTMNQDDRYRKLMINLEPCRGVVYLFVRKTRPCYPNPYSCIKWVEGMWETKRSCEWTHFMSEIDGSLDGAPTSYEVPLSATKYYIAVFATVKSQYRLTVMADTGAMPRPGNQGRLDARQDEELAVVLTWTPATFMPSQISWVKNYMVYSSMLLEGVDSRSNANVFLHPEKILNTVCGLTNNTDRYAHKVDPADCEQDVCTTTIRGVMTQKKYAFNVVVESARGYMAAYGGLLIQTNWKVYTKETTAATLRVVSTVAGATLAAIIIAYIWLLKLYN